MTETVASEPISGTSKTCTSIREKLLAGTAPLNEFAQAIGKTPRTVASYIAQGMPTLYVGRTPYPQVDEAIAWLRTRRVRQEPAPPRGRGRPRKVA